MPNVLSPHENWAVLKTVFPQDWEALAIEKKALVRKLRSFKDTESVMRTLLLHVANGYSLRETVTRAKLSNLADVSDVALLKRLQCAEEWFKALCLKMLRERGIQGERAPSDAIEIRIVDGTIVKEPGKTGSQWRVHYSIRLSDLHCDYFKLSAYEGEDTGESFKQFPVKKGECIIGDRAYSTQQGIAYLSKKGAYSLVRVNTGALKFYEIGSEKKFDLLDKLKSLQTTNLSDEWRVKIQSPQEGEIEGRLCVVRKSETAAELAIAKIKRQAKKRQREIKPETLEYARYVIIFTTLPIENFPTCSVLEGYRLRWQIELVFKRLKSLAEFGHLPKYDDTSARAWLYGKLFVGLLTEKLVNYARALSPWGYEQ
jgi:hypothetical protein